MIFSGSCDPLGRYYTSASIGALLVDSIAVPQPAVVVDLGAGDGMLVGQASAVWKKARFVTVDIDHDATSALFPEILGPLFEHHVCDALEQALDERLGATWGNADVALCNPPYIRPKWKSHFGRILKQAGLDDILPRHTNVPADLLFIAQNLRLLKDGGRLGLIVPDGMIAGEKFATLRRRLAEQHTIRRLIELPRGIFRNTDAKAHILVIEKGGRPTREISVQRLQGDGQLSRAITVAIEKAAARMDYSYLSRAMDAGRNRVIGDVVTCLRRGFHTSASRRDCSFPVFHTTDFEQDSAYVPQSFCLGRRAAQQSDGVVAQPGDILVARVGRNLNQKVAQVQSGYVVISDCVFLIRVAPPSRSAVLRHLRSDMGREALNSIAHGVGAKFLTETAIMTMSY